MPIESVADAQPHCGVLQRIKNRWMAQLWYLGCNVCLMCGCGWCRFRWVAIRVWCMRMWQGTIAAIYFALNWLVYKLDYARSYRCRF